MTVRKLENKQYAVKLQVPYKKYSNNYT